MQKRIVYLDHASATPMDPMVKEAMEPYLSEVYGNPSALYGVGRAAKAALDNARETVAQILNCTAAEVVFTGSGTESDNLAIFGVARGYTHNPPQPSLTLREGAAEDSPLRVRGDRGVTKGHIIITAFEHHAVLNPCEALQKEGYDITYLKVDRDGLVTPDQLKAAIRPNTILVSIMYANNEIGTIEPIAEIAKTIRDWKRSTGRGSNDPPFLHTDACQAAGYLDIDVKNLGVDLMTINGSKIYGPKGTGALFVRRGLRLKPIVYGGGQEFGLRSGTENVAGIVGFAKALDEITKLRDHEITRLTPLRDKLISGIIERIPKVMLNGHPTKRLPNNVNVAILDIEGEAMLFYLDEYGIAASVGSACESAGPDPSHVIQALGKSRDAARSAVRFTLGRSTTEADIEYVLDVLPHIVAIFRKISPVHLEVREETKIGTQSSIII